jgi:hypothetical protein
MEKFAEWLEDDFDDEEKSQENDNDSFEIKTELTTDDDLQFRRHRLQQSKRSSSLNKAIMG